MSKLQRLRYSDANKYSMVAMPCHTFSEASLLWWMLLCRLLLRRSSPFLRRRSEYMERITDIKSRGRRGATIR